MITFTYSPEDTQYDSVEKIRFEVSDHADLTEMLQAYEQFLRALGYYFNGHVSIEEEEDETSDNVYPFVQPNPRDPNSIWNKDTFYRGDSDYDDTDGG